MHRDPNCPICRSELEQAAIPGGVVWQDDRWLLRHLMPGRGVPGWTMLQTRRHVPGITAFDDAEAGSFGPVFRHLQRVQLAVTGALRIYTASMNESAPHFHCHFVPRYCDMPKGAVGWDVFDLFRATGAGEVAVDDAASAALADRYRAALRADPPPAWTVPA